MTTQMINATIQENRPILQRFAFKFTKDPFEVEDLVQETFMRSLKTIEKLINDPKLLTWLFVIMKNIYINKYRKINRYKQIETHLTHSANTVTCKNNAESNLVYSDINTALKKLKTKHYECIVMHLNGYKYHEIAACLQVPEGTIKTRVQLCKKILKKELKSYRS
ncbi:RNA polymerase sigma factor [Sphingobacterium rhinopitheci]|uniref:RNA polymerase sigma factor n=1 Tax=Sphingobacterium rhinopitheci TaxID=2781960 RepID=UPI001F51E4D0|nr:RNA polymerase sigma factor [Sphingobacterium rhinopitheci]MCI0919841.1 RNA polymerase sigma factor [Sphingobacterium rhinopitheci]